MSRDCREHLLQKVGDVLLGDAPPPAPRGHERRVEPDETFPRRGNRAFGAREQASRRRAILAAVVMSSVEGHPPVPFRARCVEMVTAMLIAKSSDEITPASKN